MHLADRCRLDERDDFLDALLDAGGDVSVVVELVPATRGISERHRMHRYFAPCQGF